METVSTTHILAIEHKLDKFISSQEAMNKDVTSKLDNIERGLYGDPQNDQPGLLALKTEVSALKAEVKKLKLFKTVTILVGITLLVIMGVVGPEQLLTLITL